MFGFVVFLYLAILFDKDPHISYVCLIVSLCFCISDFYFHSIRMRQIKNQIKELQEELDRRKWSKFISDLWRIRNENK